MGNVANYVNIFFLEFTITFFSLQTLSPQFFLLVFSHRRMEATTAHIRNTTLALPFSPLASVPMSSHPFTWAISDIFYCCSYPGNLYILAPFHALLLLFSHSIVSNSLRPWGLQHARLPCLHHLPEFAQTHVHGVSDAIQPSHSLSPLSPLVFNLAQHQGLFQWIFRTDFL